jgi:hypothetical protein
MDSIMRWIEWRRLNSFYISGGVLPWSWRMSRTQTSADAHGRMEVISLIESMQQQKSKV